MKFAVWMLFLPVAMLVALGYLDCLSDNRDAAAAAPPLSLEGYLDEKLPEASPKAAAVKADNFACYVCHGNYDGEELVVMHGKKSVGCIDCHGESHAHRNDEDNITPPDKMYALETVDPMCSGCHEEHNVAATDVIARWRQRCAEKTDPKKITCTDCHGQHRLKLRTVRWDKRTGKLIVRKQHEQKELQKY